MNLAGKVALVTGAAKRVGRELALALGRQGCAVAVHYRSSAEAAEETVEDLHRAGVEAAALQADLTEPEAIAHLFQELDRTFDRLDLLVNSAALFQRQPFAEITAESWDRSLEVNLRAPFLCMQHAAERMTGADRDSPGLVVNLCDHSGTAVWPGYVQHGVSKAGLLHLTRIAARELAPEVRVNAIVPGAILPHPGRPSDDPAFLALGERLPLERVGSPEAVARTLLFLAENDFITGAAIPVDGGEHLLAGSGRS